MKIERLQKLLAVTVFALLTSCAPQQMEKEKDQARLERVSYSDLSGWRDDDQAAVLTALQKSCSVWKNKGKGAAVAYGSTVADWLPLCATAANLGTSSAREFFEEWLRPYRLSGNNGADGLFTGYYEAMLRGSQQRTLQASTPLYAMPDDLLSADLGLFKRDLAGQKIVGKVSGKKFVPYDDRAEIVAGSLTERAKVLAWVDDPVAAFFLAIQGSGQVAMADGKVLHLGYAGSNGRAYVAIGKLLADEGAIARPVTMEKIRAYLADQADKAEKVMSRNPSYIFFREIGGEGPLGAMGVALTPGRSLAVDPAYVPLGLPLWLDTTDGKGSTLRRVMVAQDTGGAIKGVVRGDVFWGAGAEAEAHAGAMQNAGQLYILLPKSVNPRW